MANALAWVTSGVGYIMQQDFESAGVPSGWASGGTVTFHNTTSPLEGTGDLKEVGSVTTQAHYTFSSDLTELWQVCILKFVSLPSSGFSNVIQFYDASFNNAMLMEVFNTGKVRGVNGVGFVGDTVDPVVAGTLYYVKIHYKQGSGADSLTSIELSTSGTFINSGNLYISTTTGSSVRDVKYDYFMYTVDGEVRYDHIRVSATDLGNSFSNWT